MSIYVGSWDIIGDTLVFTVNTHNTTTGAQQDADSLPTFRVYENLNASPVLTGAVALFDSTNTTGFYSGAITLSGLSQNNSYNIRVEGTVGGVTSATILFFQIKAKVDAQLSGPSNVTLTIEEADTTPIGSVYVVIKDVTEVITLWTGITDINGQVTFTAQDTSYKVILNKVGVAFNASEDLTVSGTTAETYNGTVLVIPTPGSPEAVTIYEDFRNQDDNGIPSSIDVTAEIIKLPYNFNDTVHKGDKVDAIYNNVTGRATWELVKGAKVRFRDGAGGSNFGIDKTVIIPNTNARLSDLT
jgi:hypothetical protein